MISLGSRVVLILEGETPSLPPLSNPEEFENVFLRSYSRGRPKIMRHHGDSLLRTITLEVLSEIMGKENDSEIMNMIPWAVSNIFYEQIFLHYGFNRLRPGLAVTRPRSLAENRGDVVEAYMAGIAMDVAREGGEGYQEIRNWFIKIMTLRLDKVVSGSYARDISPTSYTQSSLLNLRQTIFDDMSQIMKEVPWTTTTTTAAQLHFWSSVRDRLDALRLKIIPSEEAQAILVHYYRVTIIQFASL